MFGVKWTNWFSLVTIISAVGMVILTIGMVWSYLIKKEKYPEDVADPSALQFPLPSIPSAVFLPLLSVTKVDKDILLATQITEDLHYLLASVPELFLIANESSIRMQGLTLNLKQISESLGVRYLITGSLERIQNQYRLFVRVVDMFTGEINWADNFDNPTADFSDLYPIILKNIGFSLNVKLSEKSNLKFAKSLIDRDKSVRNAAKADFLEKNGNYSKALNFRIKNVTDAPSSFKEKWELSLALIRQKNFMEAYLSMKEALRLNPLNSNKSLLLYADLAYRAGMPLKGLESIEKYLLIRPSSIEALLLKLVFLTTLDRKQEVEVCISKLLKLYPTFKLDLWLKRISHDRISDIEKWLDMLVEIGVPK